MVWASTQQIPTVFKKVDFPDALEPVIKIPFFAWILFATGFSISGWYISIIDKNPFFASLLFSFKYSGTQYIDNNPRKEAAAIILSKNPYTSIIWHMLSSFSFISFNMRLNWIKSIWVNIRA